MSGILRFSQPNTIAAVACLAGYLGTLAVVTVIVRRAIRPALQPLREAVAAADQQGYDRGWYHGRRSARPVLVPLHQDMRESTN